MNQLFGEREKIKAESAARSGRMPQVCHNEVINELARLMPLTVGDLTCISGLGSVFSEKYGERFVRVIRQHRESRLVSCPITHETLLTLKNLEQRMTDINIDVEFGEGEGQVSLKD